MEILKSKKFWTACIGFVVAGLSQLLGLDQEVANKLTEAALVLFGASALGQGMADVGKEKAKVEHETVKYHDESEERRMERYGHIGNGVGR